VLFSRPRYFLPDEGHSLEVSNFSLYFTFQVVASLPTEVFFQSQLYVTVQLHYKKHPRESPHRITHRSAHRFAAHSISALVKYMANATGRHSQVIPRGLLLT
jgi:hypothetical protein